MTEHASVSSFRSALAATGGTGRIVVLPDSVHTAALAAEALGCEVGAIANCLLFDGRGSPVLILTSGAHRVDTAKVAAELGVEQLKRATPEFVREHTGQVIGGVSPIDHPRPCRRTSTASSGSTTRSGRRLGTRRRSSPRRTTSCWR